eukprot:1338345-Amorphochlora_amoeboformis.AAC.2
METPSSSQEEKKTPLHFSCKAHNSEYITTILSVLQMEKDKQVAYIGLTGPGYKSHSGERQDSPSFCIYEEQYLPRVQTCGREGERQRVSDRPLCAFGVLTNLWGGISYPNSVWGPWGESGHHVKSQVILVLSASTDKFDIRLESEGIITECAIRTIEGPKPLDFNFRSSILLNQASMKVKKIRGNLEYPV